MKNFAWSAIIALIATLLTPITSAQALVSETTVSGKIGGNAATTMAKGNTLTATTQGPISHVGPATQIVSSAWSRQSLKLASSSGITYPEGWSLQYSVDGATWTSSAPTDLETVVGVRTTGHVDSIGAGNFLASAPAEPHGGSSFTGSGGGDGYDIEFGMGLMFNSYHHASSLTIDCHKQVDGSTCYKYTNAAYSTGQASRTYFNKTNKHLYTVVGKNTGGDTGVVCLDYSNVLSGTVTPCSTAFTTLVAGNPSGSTAQYRLSSTSRQGSKIWAADANRGVLLCFDMDANGGTGGVCAGGNGFVIGSPEDNPKNGLYNTRVTAVQGKAFFTINDTLGCYDPATNGFCGGNSPVAITAVTSKTGGPAAGSHRHAPIPVENTDGSFRGVCDVYSRVCISTTGAAANFPTGLDTYWDANPPDHLDAGINAQQWAYSNHRLYYGGSTKITGHWGPSSVLCWDYSTDAWCSGFDSTGALITDFYTANINPADPGCVWVNQDTGVFVPLDATTGSRGCDGGSNVTFPITADVKRMACSANSSVLSWITLTINLPNSVDPANVKVTITDSSNVDITAWKDMTIDASGEIDISTLSVESTGLNPSVRVDGINGVTPSDLVSATADITFAADEPELCIDLTASIDCIGIANNDSPDVPDGIVWGKSVTTPDGGGSAVTTEDTMTVTGTNTGTLCAASLPRAQPDKPNLPVAVAGNGSATISWNEPVTGGFANTYTVTSSPEGKTCTATAPDTSCTVSGLTNGTSYTFTVLAENETGSSTQTEPTAAVTPTGPPNPPTNVTATGANGSAAIRWTAPAGGGVVSSYTVTSSPEGKTCTSNPPSTTCEITGLTNGADYSFVVTATNGAGSADSDPSASITIAEFDFDLPLTVTFNSVSSRLTDKAKSDITAYVNTAYFKTVTCTGSSQGQRLIEWLAKARAKAACDFAKQVQRTLVTKSAITKKVTISITSRTVVMNFGPLPPP